MTIVVVGLNHQGASLEKREKVAFTPGELIPALAGLREAGNAREGVMLSTCNRTEIYLVAGEGAGDPAEAAWELLGRRLGEDARPLGYAWRDEEAVAHLFRVAAGLDSMILGEAQIHGQVRDAWERSRAHAGVVLNRLFQTALLVAGRVRSETAIGRGAASVSSASVQLAKQIFGSIGGLRAMVLGAGEMAELALECFASEGVLASIVANRTYDRAVELAERHGARAIAFDDNFWRSLDETDLLLSSTAAPVPVVTVEKLRPALARRGDRPLCILDIAVPRDVDPAARDLDNVYLYDLDDLQAVVSANLERRRAELPAAEALVREEVQKFWHWLAGLAAVPTLTQFRSEMDRIREREVASAMKKLSHLSPEERAAFEHFSRSLMNKFLHEPSVRLREAASNGGGLGIVDAVRYLFGLADRDAEEARDPTRTRKNG